MLSTLTERGQISVPAKIRHKYNLKPGMGFIWLERDEGIFLMPVPEDPISAFQNQAGPGSADLLKSRQRDKLKGI